MAVTLDLGDVDDIHPRNKRAFAHRLALLAEAQSYGQPIRSRGPEFIRAIPQGTAMIAYFSHGAGLVNRDLAATVFEVAGEDRTFHAARGTIVGETLLVSSSMVPKPIAVRYAWHNAPVAVLFNSAELPAAPFRSDTWPSGK